VIGKWTAVDPLVEVGQESMTPYGYVFDDPISHTDPDGKVPCCAVEISVLEAGFTAAGEVEGGSFGSGTPIAGGIVLGTLGAVASVYIGEHLPSYSVSINTAHSGGSPVMQRDGNLQPTPILQGASNKNRLPDVGTPNTMDTNKPGTTTKVYGPNGQVQKEYNKGHPEVHTPSNERSDHVHDHRPNPNPGNPTKTKRMPGRAPKPNEMQKDKAKQQQKQQQNNTNSST